MSESIFVRIGHVGGHAEELQVFSDWCFGHLANGGEPVYE
jgi:hypothetical protein